MTPADIERVFGRGRLRMVTGSHVEVFREPALPGERRRYTKRFLATEAGDFRHWTEREWRILARLVGHGIGPVPDVVQYDRGVGSDQLARVQTYDAGITVDHWATLLPVRRGGQRIGHVFQDCAHWWALARHSLIALDAIHEIGLVHLDLKADNICIPYEPAGFDPAAPAAWIAPRIEQIALIDFAFSLVSGEQLTRALPIARQSDYDYQSPRLLDALAAGHRGDLGPTRRLDWRCDLFSLAAMLRRYLPDPEAAPENGWTPELDARARALVRRLLQAHDAELPAQRPHADLFTLASAPLADARLAASLQSGWWLAPAGLESLAQSPTPVTRIAAPVQVAAQAEPPREVQPQPEPQPLLIADVREMRAARSRPWWPWVAATAAAAALAVPVLGEGWRRDRAHATAAPSQTAGEPAALPRVVAAGPVAEVVAAPAVTASAGEGTAAAEQAAAAPGTVVDRDTPAMAVSADAAPAIGSDDAASAPTPASIPATAPVTVPADRPARAAAAVRPVPPPVRVAAARVSAAAPRRGSTAAKTPPTRPATRLAAAQPSARGVEAMRASAARAGGAAKAPPTAPSRVPAVVLAQAPGLPTAPPILPPAPVTLPPAPVTLPPAPVTLPPAPVTLPPAPAALPPATTATLPPVRTATVTLPAVAPPSPSPVRDHAARADDLLVAALPRLAQRAERLVLPVLGAVAAGAPVGEVRSAARTLRLAPSDPQLEAGSSAADARALNEAARQALWRRGSLSEAVQLQTQAFGANPLDAEVAGNLAQLRLRERPHQPELARQLVLHALTLPDPRHPHGRSEDWTTLAVASALAGREREARHAWWVSLELASSPQRQCRAAVAAYAHYGERLRGSVQALLHRAQEMGLDAEAPQCEWPAHWRGPYSAWR